MVRSLVGSMKVVGEGVWSPERFREALQARQRKDSAAVAPPHGLYLVAVEYDDEISNDRIAGVTRR
jgi:tRNA pseudouridine38-40 synthase